MFPLSHLRYSDGEREWFGLTVGTPGSQQVEEIDGVRQWKTIPGTPARLAETGAALVPQKGMRLTPEFVSQLEAAAQWAYRANSSTRGGKVAPRRRPAAAGGKRAPAVKDLELQRLRSRVRELEADNQRLGRLLAEKGRRHVADAAGADQVRLLEVV